MVRVVGIDHLVISVGDFEKSKSFYAPLMAFPRLRRRGRILRQHDGLGQRQDAVLDRGR